MKIDIEMPKDRQMRELLKMLAWMEFCGNIGHCTSFRVIFDGDGTAKLGADMVGARNRALYESMKKEWLDRWNTGHTEEPVFEFGL